MKAQKAKFDKKNQDYTDQLKKIRSHTYYDSFPESSTQYSKFLTSKFHFWADVSFNFYKC